MAYRLRYGEGIMEGVRRIGHEQGEKAVAQLDAASKTDEFGELRDSVHACRKHCKKLRGLIRLIRPGMEDVYQQSNVAFRDAARQLAPIRDAHAIADTFGELIEVAGGDAPEAAHEVGTRLRDAATRMSSGEIEDRIAEARSLIDQGVDLIEHWDVDDPLTAVQAGIAKTHKRSHNRLEDLRDCVDTETLHQWRKRVKYGWYHSRILRDAAPSILTRQASRLHDLSDALGDDHDLSLVDRRLAHPTGDFEGISDLEDVRRWMAGWRWDLQARALSLGSRLIVEDPASHAARMSGYLGAWERFGPERKAGELEAIVGSEDG